MNHGNGDIKICLNCGEAVYVFKDDIKICPKCRDVVLYFDEGD